MARVTIDGRDFEVSEGRNLLETCLSLDFHLPYFCWHPALGSLGACRQCAVTQYKDASDDEGKLVMACMTPASDGTRISIEDEQARSFRESVIEWLMLNHPHDCPICDEGGECHLQDMTVMTGHNLRRTRFPKRTFKNQDLGPFVDHEMNRCIECYRCVRFYREHAGGSDLAAFAAHDHVYFGRMSDGKLESAFSGNLVEICPTGVFTDKTLKGHYTRKWDLGSAPSLCAHCGLGCNTDVGERYGKLRRVVNRFHREVNGYFLCDRGRFGYEFNESDRRVRRAFHRKVRSGPLEPIGSAVALAALRESLAAKEGKTILGIGSPRASLESNYLLRRLVGEENFFIGVSGRERDRLEQVIRLLRRLPTASLRDIENSDAALVLGEDVTSVAPRMALAVRQVHRNLAVRLAAAKKVPSWNDTGVRDVAQDERAPLVVATPFASALDDAASETVRAVPEEIARLGLLVARTLSPEDSKAPEVESASREELERAKRIADALRPASRTVVIAGTSFGERSLLDAAARVVGALRSLGRDARLAPIVPEANSFGVALLGGGSLEEAAARARDGATTLVVLENDLERRSPGSEVLSLFADVERLVVLDSLRHGTSARADLLLPAATVAESEGTFVNNEGRAQRFFQVFVPDREIRESWRWLAAASTEDASSAWHTIDEVHASLVEAHPGLSGVERAAPPASFRLKGQRVPREPNRYSGRTAMAANVDVHEASVRDDPDSPLAFSMEGYRGRPPLSLLPFAWSPGWNSHQALNVYRREIGDDGGGVRLVHRTASGNASSEEDLESAPVPAPGPFRPRRDRIRLWPFFELFGSEELSLLAPAVASLAPTPFILLSPEDAARRGLAAGDSVGVAIATETEPHIVTVKIMEGIVPGSGGLSYGIGSLRGIGFPAWARVGRTS